jgi:aminopeptidase N
MLSRIIIFFFCFFLYSNRSSAQTHYQRSSEIDVLHYNFNLTINDQNDVISGKAEIDIRFLKPVSTFALDLVGQGKDGNGMKVMEIRKGKDKLHFAHSENRLNIRLDKLASIEDTLTFMISYEGIPGDGLIISENKHGDRTFFGDNWPDRAHHWLPTVDHPSDKATVEFIITAPDHYQVVANGEQIEETNISDDKKTTHWKESVPLPTKVMVFGAARFAVNNAGYVNHVPVSSWVYPQDRDNGFLDYKIAIGVLDYFDKKIATYPYEKLANVQSKTRYGGMENAGNIFYYENSVNGNQDQEKLIAHEIAHQWFGNSASELNWHHIWLSEGFATYMTDLYLEDVRGREAFIDNLKKERQQVINYAQKKLAPIVDVSVTDYNNLLNPNSYQKGAWVLHMLRHELGDELFLAGIQKYYDKYALSNALSEDFQQVMEEVSGKNLSTFFKQWLYQPGHPILEIEVSKRKSSITIRQKQVGNLFEFPVDFEIVNDEGDHIRKTFRIDSASQTFPIKIEGRIQHVNIDPDCWLLFEQQ